MALLNRIFFLPLSQRKEGLVNSPYQYFSANPHFVGVDNRPLIAPDSFSKRGKSHKLYMNMIRRCKYCNLLAYIHTYSYVRSYIGARTTLHGRHTFRFLFRKWWYFLYICLHVWLLAACSVGKANKLTA